MKKIIEIKLSNNQKINIETEKIGTGKKTLIFLHGGPGAQYFGFFEAFKKLSEKYTLIKLDVVIQHF